MSEKRPETDADIIMRSQRLSGVALEQSKQRAEKKYSLDLPAHMAVCDTNYLRLMKLFANMRTADTQSFALLIGDDESLVVFTVLERGPFTTLINLQQQPERAWGGAGSMQIRVYHDAHSAEVVQIQNQNRFHGVYDYPNTRMRQRDEKVQINRFLGEFLSLCFVHGASTARLPSRPT